MAATLPASALRIPMQPRAACDEVRMTCAHLYGQSPTQANPSKFTYSTQNDFGRVIEKLLFCTPKKGFSSCFFENVKEIGVLEGFKVEHSEPKYSIYSIRDAKLSTADGHVLTPSCSSSLQNALVRMVSRIHLLKNHSAALTSHPSFIGSTIGNVAKAKLHQRTADGLEQGRQRESRLYFEGGNCFEITAMDGKPRYVFGRDLSIVTHQVLRIDQWFATPDPNRPNTSYLNESLLLSKYSTDVNKLYLEGKIPDLIDKEAALTSKLLTDDDIEIVLREMAAMGLLKVFSFDTQADKVKGRTIATRYLAQHEFVKNRIFPAEIGCSAEQVVFVEQPAYHLDLMIAPGPKGSLFVQDFDEAVAVLNMINENAVALQISEVDISELEHFIATTAKLGNELKPVLGEVKRELQEAGFHLIPTPGAFYGYNAALKTQNINFLNCLTGFSPKTKHYYYIASGAKTGGKLGEILMDAYVEFLNRHCKNIAVYFAGRSPEDNNDFTEAMHDLNSPTSQLGPHCLSFELRTAPHTEES